MGRKRDDVRLDEILRYIQGHEPQRPGAIASELGLDNKTMMRALVLLEDRGDRLFEDDDERIGWFDPNQL